MKRVYEIVIFIIVFLTIFLLTSCSREADDTKNNDEALLNALQEMYPENENITSYSPDGKYIGEAYGTITEITAGGFFPYEGIRILNVDDDDVIWEMKPGGYEISFIWSPDSQYVGIYYTGRTWGESIVVDIKGEKSISLPKLEEIVSHYGESVKPEESRPDPYFEICGWKDSKTVIVDFRWTKVDGEKFNGQYTFNVKTNEVVYR
jgi:hypothetical protein